MSLQKVEERCNPFSSCVSCTLGTFAKVYKWLFFLLGVFSVVIYMVILIQQSNCTSICAELTNFHEHKCNIKVKVDNRNTYSKLISIGKKTYLHIIFTNI